jgi:hypothetical protein
MWESSHDGDASMTSVDLLAGAWTTAGAADAGTDDDRSPHDFRSRVEVAASSLAAHRRRLGPCRRRTS